jgi:translation initiation factor IF-3
MAFEDANSNEELQRYPQMLVIDLDGKNLGVLKFEQAWNHAQSKDSDLLLVKVRPWTDGARPCASQAFTGALIPI